MQSLPDNWLSLIGLLAILATAAWLGDFIATRSFRVIARGIADQVHMGRSGHRAKGLRAHRPQRDLERHPPPHSRCLAAYLYGEWRH